MDLQSMIDRGYGLYIINELLSLKIHKDNIELCMSDLPGIDEPQYIPIESRNVTGILEEAHDYITQYLAAYLEYNQICINNIVSH